MARSYRSAARTIAPKSRHLVDGAVTCITGLAIEARSLSRRMTGEGRSHLDRPEIGAYRPSTKGGDCAKRSMFGRLDLAGARLERLRG
jgi:hypothetical protein